MISDQQKKILAFPYSKYRMLICYGSIRSGKTSVMTLAFIDDAMRRYNGQMFGICGKTVRSTENNLILPYLAMARTKKRYHTSYSRSTKLLTVTKGGITNTFEVCGGNDERSQDNIQGRTWAGVLIDEAALMPQSFVNQATARCSVPGNKLWFNCNPEWPSHWFRKEWILNAESLNALVLKFKLSDNPSLTPDVIEGYRSMYHGVFYDRFINGDWSTAEGLVYQFDSQDEYTCASKEADEARGEWFISIDYGITNPFAALLWKVTPERAYLVDEYYFNSREKGRRRTDAQHVDAVEELAKGKTIERIIVDPSATSLKEEIWARGLFDVENGNNSVIAGIQVTDQMLSDGTIKIAKRCKHTIGEMGEYRWDDSKLDDAVIKENDHAMDAMRYMANTVLKYIMPNYADR